MLSAPIFEDEDKTRSASVLHLIVLILFALTLIFTVAAPFTHADPTPIWLTSLILIPLWALALAQIRQGNVKLVSILLITTLWLFFSFISFATGGVRSPSNFFFLSLIIIAALTLGRRIGLIVTGLSILATLGMLVAQMNDISPPITLPITLRSAWTVIVGNLIIAAILLIRAGHDLTDALKQVKHSENRYRAIIEDQTEFIVRWQPDGKRTFVNEAYCLQVQQKRGQLLGTSFLIQMSEANQAEVKEFIRQLTPENPVWFHSQQDTKKDGATIWRDWTHRAIFEENGEIVELQSTGRDVTARTQAEQALNRRQRELKNLLETSHDLSSTLSLEILLELIAQRALSLLDADESTIFQLEENGKTLRPIMSVGQFSNNLMMRNIAVGDGLTGYAVQKNQPILVNDAQLDARAKQVPGTPANEREHIMIVPLSSRAQLIGAMFVNRLSENPFIREDLHFFIGFSQQAAIALENARIYEALESQNVALEKAVQARTAELQSTTEQVRTILINSPDAILSLNADGIAKTCNPAFRELFGWPSEKIHGQSPIFLVTPEYQKEFAQALQASIEGRQVRLEVMAKHQDETIFDADIALAPIKKGGQIQGFVCSIRDISPLKEVQRLKDAFVSNVSHELRSPITSINLSLKLLQLKPEKMETYVERVRRETKRLSDTIEDLLQLSRMDENRIVVTFEAVDLNALTAVYTTDRKTVAENKHISLDIVQDPNLPIVNADKGLLEQVLSILLTNAIDYTPAGGQVIVSTQTEKVDGNLWAGFVVDDNGPGIPSEEQALIFERFSRGKAGHQSEVSGTGLGLALAQEIVKLHNGRLTVQSDGIMDRGAKFFVWLPVEPAEDKGNAN
ncbi:MAG: PAS domain S-box protein [Chloroflexi bacterium]|nr:PAS domain S-box protein [Chloroflexota bacterium]